MSTTLTRDAIPLAPIFRPSAKEFGKPFEFFSSVTEAGKEYGIVKIVTPEEWRPKECPKIVEPFDSYKQLINTLKSGKTFDSGYDAYTLESYREYANGLKKKWKESNPELGLDLTAYVVDTESTDERFSLEVEKAYWGMIEGEVKDKTVVEYASNHPIIKFSSPATQHKISTNSFRRDSCRSETWNLSTLIEEKDNLLRHIGADVPGVTSPWLYYGCLFATFCWHVEDHYLHSINYMHEGASKIWYGIPSRAANDFQEYITSSFTTRSKKMEILQELTLMVSPYKLPESIPVYKAVQEPGDMILTFPRAFHGGYSEGWNCAEAVNFATLQWALFGREAVLQQPAEKTIFSHDRLLWILMEEATVDQTEGRPMRVELSHALRNACKDELEERDKIRRQQYNLQQTTPRRRWSIDDPSWFCAGCNKPLFFSYVSCACRVHGDRGHTVEVLCLQDALASGAFSCGCKPYLCMERTDEELRNVIWMTRQTTTGEGMQ